MLASLIDGFFAFEKTHFFSIKGFVGDRQVEVRYRKEFMDLTDDFLYLLFSRYPTKQPDQEFLHRIEGNIQEKINVRLGEP